eukprot:TRINITY_DN15957_c0_g1_i1.p1 TRINITY_DN15957_c0_g1~~TRINITY_DN15957_c0_g1_i1.p1  ORF type:complete len:258 (+),score=46.50 TRINITY_DN15957_c0_g1_i1:93-866(+)
MPPAEQRLLLLSYPDNPRIGKALVAARFARVNLEVAPGFAFGADNATEEYRRNVHPLGKVPALKTPEGYIFECNAIARHIARLGDAVGANLYGRSQFEASQIDMWLDFANSEIDPAAISLVGPLLGVLPQPKAQASERIAAGLQRALGAIDLWLETRTFLVGERMTLADIVVVCSILPLYQLVLGPEDRGAFESLNRWFDTCMSRPEFQEELRPGPMCGAQGPAVPPQAEPAAAAGRADGGQRPPRGRAAAAKCQPE